jgi:argonaute-like protein implicated in RNA metabolism and viral defense
MSSVKGHVWTKGFIPRLQTQLGLETPNSLEIEITRGETAIETVCTDILALTKLNYNSCMYGDGLPVTLRFADRIGEVLTASRHVESGVLPFKHYV